MLHSEQLTARTLSFKGLCHAHIDGTVLATIINHKLETMPEGFYTQDLAPNRPARLQLCSLTAALSGPGHHYILECKKSSPSLGDFCPDFDLDKILDCYRQHASAISVLTEQNFFKGDLAYLSYGIELVDIPVICKDFILGKNEITRAYNAGADAVLLMLSILEQDYLLELYRYAVSLGLDVLCEVSTPEEAEFARVHGIKITGINNRDLRNLKIDLSNAVRLNQLLHDDAIVVSESGIKSHCDIAALEPIKCFLIGSSLCEDPAVINHKAKALLYGFNKVCGITSPEVVPALLESKVSLAGLIFAEKSPRFVTKERALEIIAAAAGSDLSFVGVFLNHSLEEITAMARALKLRYVQLHGSESPDFVRELKAALPGVKVIKVFSVKDAEDFAAIPAYDEVCDYFLLDNKLPGSGESFDWGAIPAALNKRKTLLSGGIGPGNISEALRQGFVGVDLNSRLEKSKGVKDPELIRDIFRIINM